MLWRASGPREPSYGCAGAPGRRRPGHPHHRARPAERGDRATVDGRGAARRRGGAGGPGSLPAPGWWFLGLVARSRCVLQRGVEVVPEVVDVFAADAQAQEPGGDVFLAGELAAPLD